MYKGLKTCVLNPFGHRIPRSSIQECGGDVVTYSSRVQYVCLKPLSLLSWGATWWCCMKKHAKGAQDVSRAPFGAMYVIFVVPVLLVVYFDCRTFISNNFFSSFLKVQWVKKSTYLEPKRRIGIVWGLVQHSDWQWICSYWAISFTKSTIWDSSREYQPRERTCLFGSQKLGAQVCHSI